MNGATGTVIWNSTQAYVFVGTYQYGYTSSYLGYVGELIKEIFPFGAASPRNKHFYVEVFCISSNGIERHFVDNFHMGSPPDAVGSNIYTGNMLNESGLMKWSRTDFVPITPEEFQIFQDHQNTAGSDKDDTGGWTKRLVDLVSAVENSSITIERDGGPVELTTHSGSADGEAYIDLARPGRAPERIWHLNEKAARVSQATYKQIFSSD